MMRTSAPASRSFLATQPAHSRNPPRSSGRVEIEGIRKKSFSSSRRSSGRLSMRSLRSILASPLFLPPERVAFLSFHAMVRLCGCCYIRNEVVLWKRDRTKTWSAGSATISTTFSARHTDDESPGAGNGLARGADTRGGGHGSRVIPRALALVVDLRIRVDDLPSLRIAGAGHRGPVGGKVGTARRGRQGAGADRKSVV